MNERCRICGGELGFMAAHHSHFCQRCGEAMKEMSQAHREIIFALADRLKSLEAQKGSETKGPKE